MTPPLAKKAGIFKFFDRPVDFNKKFRGEPLLGPHKTWRGVVLGIFVGFLVACFQKYLYRFAIIQKLSLLDYAQINILLFGTLISSGAVFGDLISAFVKRRLRLKPGAKFLPFDQTNYVIGDYIFLTPFFKTDIQVWITLFVSTFFLHIIFNRIGYHLNLHGAEW
jgi:CDP-2,3-bis-(O-geranylgeranyl)-sn-glycerol synthase